jgi:hypothetical protein
MTAAAPGTILPNGWHVIASTTGHPFVVLAQRDDEYATWLGSVFEGKVRTFWGRYFLQEIVKATEDFAVRREENVQESE